MDTYNDCYNSGKHSERVDQDFADGRAAGVSGTPGFIFTYTVDGEEKQRFIIGAAPFSDFQTLIEEILVEMGLN